jgi:hypothetical protein
MYCILDDLRKNKPIIAWSKSKFELVDNANIKLDLIQNDKSEDVGVINIGPKNQDWYFTKSLFDTTDLISSITGTIQKKMLEE